MPNKGEKMIDVYKYDYKKVKVKCTEVDKIFIGKAVADTEYGTDRDYITLYPDNSSVCYELFADEIESIEVIED